MRVGVVRGGMEVEIWKRAQRENKDAVMVKDSNGDKIARAGQQPTKMVVPSGGADAA